MNEFLTRRGFLAIAAGSVGALLQDTTHTAPVYDPARAGRPRDPTTAMDTDAGIQATEKKLRCSCGCNVLPAIGRSPFDFRGPHRRRTLPARR
jgi:hypothetical protein